MPWSLHRDHHVRTVDDRRQAHPARRLRSTSPRCRAGWRSRSTSWRRSQATIAPGAASSSSMRDAGGLGRRPHALDGVVEQHAHRHRLAPRRSWVSMRLRSSRSSTIRPRRSASFTRLSASRRRTAGSVSDDERLGEQLERADRRLQLVAHVGDEVAAHALDPVDLRDVVDEHRRAERRHRRPTSGIAWSWSTARGGPKSCSSRSRGSPARASLEQLGDRAGGDRVGVPGLAVALGGRVAEDLASVGVDDDHAVAEIDERGGEAVALGAWPRRRRLGPLRALHRAAMRHSARAEAGSAESPGDVTLGARIARRGEDLLGVVELDQPADPSTGVVDLGGEERGAVRDRAPPAACCG